MVKSKKEIEADESAKNDAIVAVPKQELVAKQDMPLVKVDAEEQDATDQPETTDIEAKEGSEDEPQAESAADEPRTGSGSPADIKQAEDKKEEPKKAKKTVSSKSASATSAQIPVSKPKKRSKQYKESKALIEQDKVYSLAEAVSLIRKVSYAKFDATVEFHARLGVDPKKPDQMVRGSVTLPHGTGKTVSVLVFAQGDKLSEAKEAGADYVGLDDLMDKISGGWMDFDVVVATPDVMGKIAKLGKILGTRGLMPNPKAGTVTFDVERIVSDLKAGRIEFKLEKLPLIHSVIGKVSFSEEQLVQNAKVLISAVNKAKPASAKGIYLQSAFLNATMSPSIKLDVQQLRNL